jgi:RNA polymerase sigma-70 factor (ECF subfamily)
MRPHRLQIVASEAPSDPPHRGTDTPQASPDQEVSLALRDLVGRFDGFIRQTAWRHGLSGSDIDEVVQDLRVRVWKSFGTSELIRRAKPSYMYRTAVSAALDLIRRRRSAKTQSSSLDDIESQALTDRAQSVDERLIGDELSRAVHRALTELHESRRAVVRLYLAGYDRFEIAELMGWTEGKTRNLLYRGLEDLRQVLTARGITRDSA